MGYSRQMLEITVVLPPTLPADAEALRPPSPSPPVCQPALFLHVSCVTCLFSSWNTKLSFTKLLVCVFKLVNNWPKDLLTCSKGQQRMFTNLFFHPPVPLQPPTPSFPRGHASSPDHRTFQCHCTRMPSWSAWPQAIPDPSSPGAEQTASLLTFTTPKCWETATSSSRTSSPSMEESICAEPPHPARETLLWLQPTSQC